MKTKIKYIIGIATLLAITATAASAQNNVTQVPDQLPPLPITPPPGAVIQPFNTNGLCFTNADYKLATGSQFDNNGGVLSYLQADVDVCSLGSADLGVGANATLSGTGTGLHSAGGFLEVIKNFNNFQFALKAGAGGELDTPAFYASQVFELNYNLSEITSGFLAGNKLFTYVGTNLETQEGRFATGGQFKKQFHIYVGWAF
jgi:hypothetical protein